MAELRTTATQHGLVRNGYTEKVGRRPAAPYQPGDLVARFKGLRPGLITASVVPLTADAQESMIAGRLLAHSDVLDVVCREIILTATGARQSLLVESPPMRRLPP